MAMDTDSKGVGTKTQTGRRMGHGRGYGQGWGKGRGQGHRRSVSDQDPVGSTFNLGLDPGSGSVFGIRIRIPDPDD